MTLLTQLPIESAPEGAVFSAAEQPRRLSPFGDWSLATWLHGICWEWCITRDGPRKVLEHPTIFTSCLLAGDGSWGDFTIEFDLRQMRPLADTSMDEIFNTRGRSGVMFRYQALRQSYALLLECQERVVLACRNGEEWTPLATREIKVDPARYYRFRIECKGERIRCRMDGEPLFDVTDPTFRRGRIAVYANTLSRFGFLRAEADDEGEADVAAYLSAERLAAARSAEGLAEPVLWKRIPHPVAVKATGCVTLDLSPAGQLEGVVIITEDPPHAEPGGRALMSVDLDGNVRWSRPICEHARLGIWDLDGDGRREVVLFDGPAIKLLDAASGELKNEASAPPCNERGNRGGRENEKPYAPIFRMVPANVRGLGPGRDFVAIDIYTAVWALNDKLELLWWRSREHGHDVLPYDIDNDGLDEIMCGHVMFDQDGSELWEVPGAEDMIFTHDHVDRIEIGEFDGDPSNGLEIVLTCGNAGVFFLDQEGRVRAHHPDLGHAQHLSTGRFRPEIPGRQVLVGTMWGNPGSRTLFTGAGERLWTIEPDNSTGRDLPVRWAPDRDLILIVSTPAAAGFYDGYGRRIMPFADAHLSTYDRAILSLSKDAGDHAGAGSDDFALLAEGEVLVYTQGQGPIA